MTLPRRLLAVATLAIALAAGVSAPASALPFLSEGDANELAQQLAEATEEQDICYAWDIYVNDASGGPDGIEAGSNFGPGMLLGAALDGCEKGKVVLDGTISFTCDSCESEDSSSIRVVTDVPNGPTTADLEALGLDGGQLKGDDGDAVLANMVGALPLITADKGAAPPIVPTPPVPAKTTDKATDTPKIPDWLRESWLPLGVCGLVIIGGLLWFLDTARRRPTVAARPRPVVAGMAPPSSPVASNSPPATPPPHSDPQPEQDP